MFMMPHANWFAVQILADADSRFNFGSIIAFDPAIQRTHNACFDPLIRIRALCNVIVPV